MFNRIKGTKDILDFTLLDFLIDKVKKQLNLYNFTQISTPILEPVELYKRSLGLETDIVSKEMYILKTDYDQESICLRPEGTASTVRAFIENNIENTPWKVFSYGPMFRHERPQKCRYRQFNQINIEIIGSKSINQDVQLIKMLERFFFDYLRLENYALLINFLGCDQDRITFKNIFKNFLDSVFQKICATCKIRKEANILRVFDCKNEDCKSIYKLAPKITDHLCHECKEQWNELKNNLEHLSVSYSHEPNLVRGLDYYQKTVFEFVSLDLGAQNAFCAGGRYDKLVKELGAKEDQPSVGAAIGVERVLLLLEKIKDNLIIAEKPALYLILPLSKQEHDIALLLCDELQSAASLHSSKNNNFSVDILLEEDSLKSMMRKANKLGAKYSIIIGPEEKENKLVTLKNMITGQEQKISQRDLIKYL